MLVLLLLLAVRAVRGEECSAHRQMDILTSVPHCTPRVEVQSLLPLLQSSNLTQRLGVLPSEVVQVKPSTLERRLCLGSCTARPYSCTPTREETEEVEVMLVLSRWPQGEHQVICTSLQVVQQVECGCRCQPLRCSSGSSFSSSSCSCICEDSSARTACTASGRQWSPSSCSCSCPPNSWRVCSTGYIFDLGGSCQCVQVAAAAHKGSVAALVLLSVSVVITVVAGFLMLRAGRGPFSALPDVGGARIRLMTQKSKSEWDLGRSLRPLTP